MDANGWLNSTGLGVEFMTEATHYAHLESKVAKWKGKITKYSHDFPNKAALLGVEKDGKRYEFQLIGKEKNMSASEAGARLCLRINQLIQMELDGIFPFSRTAKDFLALDAPAGTMRSDAQGPDAESRFYDVLGLTPEASNTQVLVVWKKVARELHPDDAPQDQRALLDAEFARASEAFSEIKKARGM